MSARVYGALHHDFLHAWNQADSHPVTLVSKSLQVLSCLKAVIDGPRRRWWQRALPASWVRGIYNWLEPERKNYIPALTRLLTEYQSGRKLTPIDHDALLLTICISTPIAAHTLGPTEPTGRLNHQGLLCEMMKFFFRQFSQSKIPISDETVKIAGPTIVHNELIPRPSTLQELKLPLLIYPRAPNNPKGICTMWKSTTQEHQTAEAQLTEEWTRLSAILNVHDAAQRASTPLSRPVTPTSPTCSEATTIELHLPESDTVAAAIATAPIQASSRKSPESAKQLQKTWQAVLDIRAPMYDTLLRGHHLPHDNTATASHTLATLKTLVASKQKTKKADFKVFEEQINLFFEKTNPSNIAKLDSMLLKIQQTALRYWFEVFSSTQEYIQAMEPSSKKDERQAKLNLMKQRLEEWATRYLALRETELQQQRTDEAQKKADEQRTLIATERARQLARAQTFSALTSQPLEESADKKSPRTASVLHPSARKTVFETIADFVATSNYNFDDDRIAEHQGFHADLRELNTQITGKRARLGSTSSVLSATGLKGGQFNRFMLLLQQCTDIRINVFLQLDQQGRIRILHFYAQVCTLATQYVTLQEESTKTKERSEMIQRATHHLAELILEYPKPQHQASINTTAGISR